VIEAGEFDYTTTMTIGEKCSEMLKQDARKGAEMVTPPAAV
jgi:hypothetical protein